MTALAVDMNRLGAAARSASRKLAASRKGAKLVRFACILPLARIDEAKIDAAIKSRVHACCDKLARVLSNILDEVFGVRDSQKRLHLAAL